MNAVTVTNANQPRKISRQTFSIFSFIIKKPDPVADQFDVDFVLVIRGK